MKHKRAVLLDTSFFLRFLNDNDSLYKNADAYFRHFLQNEIDMLISTISIAEYCIGGEINELPLKNLRIVPFNINHAQRTGEFAKIAFQARNTGTLQINERKIIPNDTKLFAQADCEKSVEFYLSSDTESLKVYNILKEKTTPKFQFLDLNTPHHETFGILDL
jgi:PIN domain nuclease of toxin-antitoxin system